MGKFILQLLIVSLLATGAYYFIGPHVPAKFFYANYIFLVVLFFFITLLFHWGLKRSFEKGSKDFVRYYMGATGAKLFAFLFIIVIYAFLRQETAMAFALSFFFFYLIFTPFEVIVSFKKFGTKAKKTESGMMNDER